MAKVVIPYPMRKHTNKERLVVTPGQNLKEILDNLQTAYPGLKDTFKSLDFISLFLNGERITKSPAEWGGVAVKENDEVTIILPIAGGIL